MGVVCTDDECTAIMYHDDFVGEARLIINDMKNSSEGYGRCVQVGANGAEVIFDASVLKKLVQQIDAERASNPITINKTETLPTPETSDRVPITDLITKKAPWLNDDLIKWVILDTNLFYDTRYELESHFIRDMSDSFNIVCMGEISTDVVSYVMDHDDQSFLSCICDGGSVVLPRWVPDGFPVIKNKPYYEEYRRDGIVVVVNGVAFLLRSKERDVYESFMDWMYYLLTTNPPALVHATGCGTTNPLDCIEYTSQQFGLELMCMGSTNDYISLITSMHTVRWLKPQYPGANTTKNYLVDAEDITPGTILTMGENVYIVTKNLRHETEDKKNGANN